MTCASGSPACADTMPAVDKLRPVVDSMWTQIRKLGTTRGLSKSRQNPPCATVAPCITHPPCSRKRLQAGHSAPRRIARFGPRTTTLEGRVPVRSAARPGQFRKEQADGRRTRQVGETRSWHEGQSEETRGLILRGSLAYRGMAMPANRVFRTDTRGNKPARRQVVPRGCSSGCCQRTVPDSSCATPVRCH